MGIKIHIICGPFYPQLHPRAFRATELAKEFIRQGNHVTISNIVNVDKFDYDTYACQTGINKINHLGLYKHHQGIEDVGVEQTRSTLKSRIINIVKYFTGGKLFSKARALYKSLDIDPDTDMVLAISTPFICILGTSYYLRRIKLKKTCVVFADSGDPFYYSIQSPKAFWFKWVEKRAYKMFDYLTIPTESAIPCYNKLLNENKIIINPQGFNMNNLHLYTGERSGVVKFAYSGVFYFDIRNPEFIFEYLDKQIVEYEFYWYMRYDEPVYRAMLDKYPNLKSRTQIQVALGRDALLYELSKMDFLINIENTTSRQLPSKLIDYGMVGRPIFSCSKATFSENKLYAFLHRDYRDSMNIDLEKYRIENIAGKYLDIYKEKSNQKSDL